MNKENTNAKKLHYHEIPEHFVWNSVSHKWIQRKRGKCVGRVYTTNPAQGERHYLCILLHHIPGASSFDDLKQLPDGTTCSTFKETATKLGLLASDDEWDECMQEASTSFMPYQLQTLFITVLVFGEPLAPQELWYKHKTCMGEDIYQHATSMQNIPPDELSDFVDNTVLLELQKELSHFGYSLPDFSLKLPQEDKIVTSYPQVILDELFNSKEQSAKALELQAMLNGEQQDALQLILQAMADPKASPQLFFINAAGGCGKTFLLETALATVCGMGKIALAVASPGIAAELLYGGRTAHSCFKIPIPVSDESVCAISLQSADA